MADIRKDPTVLDNFNYTEDPLSNGGKWALLDSTRQALQANGSQAVAHTGGATSYSYYTPLSMDGDDAECWAYTKGGNSPAQAWRFGLAASVGGSGTADGYLFSMPITTGGGSTLLQRFTNMTFTDIDSDTANPPTGGEWLGLIRRNGTSVEGWASGDGGANWTLYVSAVDTTYQTGLRAFLGISGTLVGFDYFGAGGVPPFLPLLGRRYRLPYR